MTALDDAIAASDRTPVYRLTIDFGDGPEDLSEMIESASVDQALTSDLPEQVRLVEGSSTAELKVRLVCNVPDDITVSALNLFSPYNTSSPYYERKRAGLPITFDVGFWTDEGPQYVRQFSGFTRQWEYNDDGSVDVTALDGRSLLRNSVSLPAVYANPPFGANQFTTKRPGLEAASLVSYTLAQSGLYLSPPPREGCSLWMPMHGTALPFLGHADPLVFAHQDSHWLTSAGTRNPVRFESGPFFLATSRPNRGGATQIRAFTSITETGHAPIGSDGNPYFQLECWARRHGDGRLSLNVGSDNDMTQINVIIDYDGEVKCEILWDLESGTDQFQTVESGLDWPTDGEWHRLWFFIVLGTLECGFMVDDNDPAWIPMIGPAGPLDHAPNDNSHLTVSHDEWLQVAEVQIVCGPSLGWDTASPMTVPQVAIVDRSINKLQGNADVAPREAWSILSDLASAEQGVVYFDPDGILNWRTRARLTTGRAQVVQAELTAERSLMTLQASDTADTVRNQISVPYQQLSWTSLGEIYSAPSPIELPPYVTTRIVVDVPGAMLGWGIIGMRLSQTPTGEEQGALLNPNENANFVQVAFTKLDPATLLVEFFNHSVATLWTLGRDNYADPNDSIVPYFKISGDLTDVDSGGQVSVEDSNSVIQYGPLALAVNGSGFVQSFDSAEPIAYALRADLAYPRTELDPFRVIGNPLLRLGDLVTISDSDGLRLDGSYWISSINQEASDSGYFQTIAVRKSRYVTLWDQGIWDDPNEMWV